MQKTVFNTLFALNMQIENCFRRTSVGKYFKQIQNLRWQIATEKNKLDWKLLQKVCIPIHNKMNSLNSNHSAKALTYNKNKRKFYNIHNKIQEQLK